MGLSLAVKPAAEPITVDEAAQHCRISDDIDNGLLAGYIMAARQFAEDQTRCAFLAQTYDYTVDNGWSMTRVDSQAYAFSPYYFYRSRITLPRRPLIAVQWVRYVDINGATQTLDPAQYVVIADATFPCIEPAFGIDWPLTRYQPAAIQIRFDAGFGTAISDIPETIRQAMLMLIAYWYDNRGSAQFGARAHQGEAGSITSSIVPSEFPPAVTALLSRYAVPRVLA